MASGEHSHWERYISRIVPEKLATSPNRIVPEKLQLICLGDGIVFHEKEITSPELM